MRISQTLAVAVIATWLATYPNVFVNAQSGGSGAVGAGGTGGVGAGTGAGGTAGAGYGVNPNGLGTGGVSSGGTGGGIPLPGNNGVTIPGPGSAGGTLGRGQRDPGAEAASSVGSDNFSSGGLRNSGPRPSGAATAPAWFGGSDVRPDRKPIEPPSRLKNNVPNQSDSSSLQSFPATTFRSPSDIALLDVSKVIRTSKWCQRKTNGLKQKISDFEKGGGGAQASLRATALRLKELPVDSDDFVKLQLQFVAKNTSSQVNFAREQKMIVAEESSVYVTMYEEIRKATAIVARERGVRLVLRYESEAVDAENRDTVLRGLGRSVVFQDDLDITEPVIVLLDSKKD